MARRNQEAWINVSRLGSLPVENVSLLSRQMRLVPTVHAPMSCWSTLRLSWLISRSFKYGGSESKYIRMMCKRVATVPTALRRLPDNFRPAHISSSTGVIGAAHRASKLQASLSDISPRPVRSRFRHGFQITSSHSSMNMKLCHLFIVSASLVRN